jgi:hypothetical protein
MKHLTRLLLAAALAGSTATADQAATDAAATGAATDGLWTRAMDYAGTAWEQTRRLWREDHPEDARLWDGLAPRLDRILGLQERERSLPESVWFGEDRDSNRARVDELLDEAARILVGSDTLRIRAREMSALIADNRREITELKRRRLAAPSESVWRKTVQDIEHEIAERERLLAEQQAALAGIRRETAAELRALGLGIDAEGLEFMLATVVGEDVLDMALAFEQVRRLTAQLERLTVESREDLPTARRYYGMYVVLLQILDHMHARLVEGIAEDYLPRVATIGERARELSKETRRLQSRNPSSILAANLEAQQLTIDAVARYTDYLQGQRRQVEASRQRLARDLAVAGNTYETVKISGDLVALMQDSRVLLEQLFRLQVPPLRPFENLEMKREFERLTASLREASAA